MFKIESQRRSADARIPDSECRNFFCGILRWSGNQHDSGQPVQAHAKQGSHGENATANQKETIARP